MCHDRAGRRNAAAKKAAAQAGSGAAGAARPRAGPANRSRQMLAKCVQKRRRRARRPPTSAWRRRWCCGEHSLPSNRQHHLDLAAGRGPAAEHADLDRSGGRAGERLRRHRAVCQIPLQDQFAIFPGEKDRNRDSNERISPPSPGGKPRSPSPSFQVSEACQSLADNGRLVSGRVRHPACAPGRRARQGLSAAAAAKTPHMRVGNFYKCFDGLYPSP
jgi:hypothetical protein